MTGNITLFSKKFWQDLWVEINNIWLLNILFKISMLIISIFWLIFGPCITMFFSGIKNIASDDDDNNADGIGELIITIGAAVIIIHLLLS